MICFDEKSSFSKKCQFELESNFQTLYSRPVIETTTQFDSRYGSGSQTGLDSQGSGNKGTGNGGDDQEYGNLLPYLGYREEDRSCPEGWVMDIYGYCRLN